MYRLIPLAYTFFTFHPFIFLNLKAQNALQTIDSASYYADFNRENYLASESLDWFLNTQNNLLVTGERLKNHKKTYAFQYYYALCLYNNFHFNRALNKLKEIFHYYDLKKNTDHLYLSALNLYGQIFEAKSKNKKALEVYLDLKNILEANPPNNIHQDTLNYELAACYHSLSSIYQKLKIYKHSLAYSCKALEIFEQLNDSLSIAYVHSMIAASFHQDDNLIYRAFNHHEKAIYFFEQKKSYFNILSEKLSLGFSYEKIDSLHKAKNLYEQVADEPFVNEVKQLKFEALLSLGVIDLKFNQNKKALQHVLKAHQIAEKSQKSFLIHQSALYLYRCYKKLGHHREALSYFETYHTQKELSSTPNIGVDLMSKEVEQVNINLKQERELRKLRQKQSLFVILSCIALLIFFIVLFFLRQRTLKLKNDYSKAINTERLLRAQMKPHFLFNTLQTIQGMIINQNKSDLNRFLVTFSKLIRKVFDYSDKQYITIEKEVALLKEFLIIQKQVQPFQINYTIDLNVELKKLVIAPMLVQPIVENSLQHGDYTNKIAELNISFKKQESNIVIQINDNGGGIKTKFIEGKHALKILKKRLQLLNSVHSMFHQIIQKNTENGLQTELKIEIK